MLSDDKMSIVEELLNYSEDIRNSFNKLMEYEINKRESKYVDESIKLKDLLFRENRFYEKINKDGLYRLIVELDENELIKNLESNLDKFYNLVNLDKYYEDLSIYRILNIIRDKSIIHARASLFDDVEVMDEEEIEDYEDKLFNTILIEFQLFNDLLSLFIANVNETISLVSDEEIRKDLIIYKYISAYIFGKNDLDLISRNKKLDNTYVYSKLLTDMIEYSDREILYNYDIIKTNYLEKALYHFVNNLDSNPKEANMYINSCFAKALISLFGEDYSRSYKLYFNERRENYNTKSLDMIFNNAKKIAGKTKVLTLNK